MLTILFHLFVFGCFILFFFFFSNFNIEDMKKIDFDDVNTETPTLNLIRKRVNDDVSVHLQSKSEIVDVPKGSQFAPVDLCSIRVEKSNANLLVVDPPWFVFFLLLFSIFYFVFENDICSFQLFENKKGNEISWSKIFFFDS